MFSRSKSDIQMTDASEFSSTGAEAPFSTPVDGDVQSGDRANASVDIDSGNYCLFIDGGWNCAGGQCSNRSHRVS
jgi:hypothetical protein